MLGQELHKPVIKKFRRKVCVGFRNKIWTAELADMGIYLESIMVFNIYYLLYISLPNMLELNI